MERFFCLHQTIYTLGALWIKSAEAGSGQLCICTSTPCLESGKAEAGRIEQLFSGLVAVERCQEGCRFSIIQTSSEIEEKFGSLLIDIDHKFRSRLGRHEVRQKCRAEEEGPEVSRNEKVAVGNRTFIKDRCAHPSN